MKKAVFYYDTINLGDYIQTIATENALGCAIDYRLERDHLNSPVPEDVLVIMQGYFSHYPYNFPPHPLIHPVFYGYHIGFRVKKALAKDPGLLQSYLDYYRRHEPIGCRDNPTRDFLQSHGVDAFYSRCLTQTLPRRPNADKMDHFHKIFVVDICHDDHHIEPLKEVIQAEFPNDECECVSHVLPINRFFVRARTYSYSEKYSLASELLERYKCEAKAIITSRIHCAMPCIAMGIPVFYVNRLVSQDQKDRQDPIREFPIPQMKISFDENFIPRFFRSKYRPPHRHVLNYIRAQSKCFPRYFKRKAMLPEFQRQLHEFADNLDMYVIDTEERKSHILQGLRKQIERTLR